MSPIATIIILGITASFLASILTVAAAMLSSRISRAENIEEKFVAQEEPAQLFPEPYSLKG